MEFRRQIHSDLLKWSKSKDRKPLILRGARQVGKTALLKEFGDRHFKRVFYYDFESNREIHQLFEGNLEPERIIRSLSSAAAEKIDPKDSLIIFDEIQECNRALTSLKYFYEERPEFAIASAGSLLGISLGKNYSFPVGKVNFLDLYPLTFMEYLETADPKVFNYYKEILSEPIQPMYDIFFNGIMDRFKEYYLSGGMPEAARLMANGIDYYKVQEKQEQILSAYDFDFSKHAHSPVEGNRIRHIWNSIPSQLGKENKKFIYKVARKGARAREYEGALLWLDYAGLIHKVSRVERPMLPLKAYDDLTTFKIYALDVGLLGRMAELNHHTIINRNKLFREFKGALAENYVCQALNANFKISPRYWTSGRLAEVDFILQYKGEIIPIEVKSDSNTKSQSLRSYNNKYDPKIRVRISTKNLSFDGGLLNIPIFYVDQLKHFIDLALKNN